MKNRKVTLKGTPSSAEQSGKGSVRVWLHQLKLPLAQQSRRSPCDLFQSYVRMAVAMFLNCHNSCYY